MAVVELDLDAPDPGALQRVVDELSRRAEIRAVEPGLRADIGRSLVLAELTGRLDEPAAVSIRADLDETHPAVVLAAHFEDLVSDRPALGAFPLPVWPAPPTTEEWVRADPGRLGGLLRTMAEHVHLQAAAASVLELAEQAGIDRATAATVLAPIVEELSVRDSTYGAAALERACRRVGEAEHRDRRRRLRSEAYSIGRLVAGREIRRRTTARDRLVRAGLQRGLSRDVVVQTVDGGLAAGGRRPRSAPGR